LALATRCHVEGLLVLPQRALVQHKIVLVGVFVRLPEGHGPGEEGLPGGQGVRTERNSRYGGHILNIV